MAKLIVKVNTYSPATSVVNNTQVIRISVGNIILPASGDGASGVIDVSRAAENIITKKIDGIYATVEKPENILSFIAAMDAAIN